LCTRLTVKIVMLHTLVKRRDK